MPTTLARGAKSFFVSDADAFAEAPGFRRTHVVEDAGHAVQGEQPQALVDILRAVLTVRAERRASRRLTCCSPVDRLLHVRLP